MITAYKYRIYPNTEQQMFFAKSFGCCRKVWNLMLSDRQKYYQACHKSLYVTPAQYKQQYPFLKEVDSLALANVQLQLQKAFRAFFEHKAEYPQFKNKHHTHKSYTTNNQNGTAAVLSKAIRIPKAGTIRAVIHRQPPAGMILKSVTISQDSDGRYYASCLYKNNEPDLSIPTDSLTDKDALGLDYKSDGLYVDSDGYCPGSPKYFRKQQKQLKRQQRKLKRKTGQKKGETPSANCLKQRHKVNVLYAKTKHQRQDYLQKLSAAITKRYKVVCVENLNLKGMSSKKGFRLGKATMDNGYGMFVRMLEYKLQRNGGYLVKVSRWYPSSQICHVCGHKDPITKNLKVRTWICPVCGTNHDRDRNAAVNIKNEGLRLLKAAA